MNKSLYDIFSHWYRGGNIWLYSDPHFGDEEMQYIRKDYIGDDEQVTRINKKVGKLDTIIFLGDIGDTECIKKIRGYKVLIMGNHDKGATTYKNVFDEVYEGPLMINDKIMLSHEPLSLPPCFFNIHGHDHSGQTILPNHLNVCAEWIYYTPISLISLLKMGAFSKVDNVHRITIDKATEKKQNNSKI